MQRCHYLLLSCPLAAVSVRWIWKGEELAKPNCPEQRQCGLSGVS